MNKKILTSMVGSALLMFAGTTSADGVTHVWACEFDDDTTYDQLVEVTKRWAAEARKIEGAEELEVYLEFPYAGDDIGDFLFVMSTPTATAWGQFMDGYEGSGVEAIDDEWSELASCDEAVVFRAVSMQ